LKKLSEFEDSVVDPVHKLGPGVVAEINGDSSGGQRLRGFKSQRGSCPKQVNVA